MFDVLIHLYIELVLNKQILIDALMIRVDVAFTRQLVMGSSFLAITDISNNHYYNYNSAMQL